MDPRFYELLDVKENQRAIHNKHHVNSLIRTKFYDPVSGKLTITPELAELSGLSVGMKTMDVSSLFLLSERVFKKYRIRSGINSSHSRADTKHEGIIKRMDPALK